MERRGSIHMVGSIAMDTCEDVFTRLCTVVGPYLRRIPDGETGERSRWIFFQREMLEARSDMEVDPTVAPLEIHEWDGKLLRSMPLLRFKPGTDVDAVQFETGYDKAAAYSYGVFERLQATGAIPVDVRFQVSLPTPMATGHFYVSPNSRDDYHRVYERSLLRAIESILNTVPHEKLAVQFDVCQEVLIFENYFPDRPTDYKQQTFSELGRMGDAIPEGVDLGYHLCYGTPNDEHLVMPKDTSVLVELMNGIAANVSRRVDYIHLPVPRHCTEPAYFRPLKEKNISADTQLYIGLLHRDDTEGNRQRIDVAKHFVDDFGLATECGWGRHDPATVAPLLQAHADAAEYLLRS